MFNELVVLGDSLSTQYKSDMNMADHVACFESKFSRLVITRTNIKEGFKGVLSLSSFGGHREYVPTIASINTLQKEVLTHSYVTNVAIKDHKWLK